MKKFVLLALLAALCGCCSYEIRTEGGKDVVMVENESFRFLGLFSIWSGDPEYPNRQVTLWFCDSLLLDVNMMILYDAMRKNGYSSFQNISTYKTSEDVLFLFRRKKLRTCAELIR
ncbi:MAG: hypothetical protein KBT68_11290 [bacterium]|nr:hypothetical protein [Candidatus Colisoma equi]